tara:strand:+ start:5844 stop:5954 length:111 start_codon:yes stop_codon:yes gene_type:complete
MGAIRPLFKAILATVLISVPDALAKPVVAGFSLYRH